MQTLGAFTGHDQNESDVLLAEALVANCLPFQLVDDPSFRAWVEKIERPGHTLPHRNKAENMCMTVADASIEKVQVHFVLISV